MQIVRLSEGAETEMESSLFTGAVYRRGPAEMAEDPYRFGSVRFGLGVRNKFHTHSADQILVITEGSGIVATETGEFVVNAGDVVTVPAGEKHWHGCGPGMEMTHVTVIAAGTTTDQLEP